MMRLKIERYRYFLFLFTLLFFATSCTHYEVHKDNHVLDGPPGAIFIDPLFETDVCLRAEYTAKLGKGMTPIRFAIGNYSELTGNVNPGATTNIGAYLLTQGEKEALIHNLQASGVNVRHFDLSNTQVEYGLAQKGLLHDADGQEYMAVDAKGNDIPGTATTRVPAQEAARVVATHITAVGAVLTIDNDGGAAAEASFGGLGIGLRKNMTRIVTQMAFLDTRSGDIIYSVMVVKDVPYAEIKAGGGRFFGINLGELNINGVWRAPLQIEGVLFSVHYAEVLLMAAQLGAPSCIEQIDRRVVLTFPNVTVVGPVKVATEARQSIKAEVSHPDTFPQVTEIQGQLDKLRTRIDGHDKDISDIRVILKQHQTLIADIQKKIKGARQVAAPTSRKPAEYTHETVIIPFAEGSDECIYKGFILEVRKWEAQGYVVADIFGLATPLEATKDPNLAFRRGKVIAALLSTPQNQLKGHAASASVLSLLSSKKQPIVPSGNILMAKEVKK